MTPLLDGPALDKLRSELHGSVIVPADPDYETARRVHNGLIDRRPAVIARCTDVEDVRSALQFGRGHDLPIAVRGGGHNVAGKAMLDDGIVIDLSGMKGIRVDRANRIARAQAGLTWGEFDRETQNYGLATTGGEVSTTGIAGLTLGGGIGYLQRQYGLACDNLLAADVLTADGLFLTASETENPDLFWGLRGGGGNFGIVTSFEYSLYPIGQVLGGPVIHSFDVAREACDFYRDFSLSAPDDVAALYALSALPDGQWAASVFVCYSGDPNAGEEAIEPVRQFGRPMEDLIQPMSYLEIQQAFDGDFPSGLNHYWKSSNVATLGDEAIDTMIEFVRKAPSLRPMVFLERFGGAVSRVPVEATAFGHRDADWDLVIAAVWSDEDEQAAHVEWAGAFWEAMQPFSTEAVYVNYLSDEGQERVRAAYGAGHLQRLVDLKRKYDPSNVFRGNQNISPG